MGWYQNYTEFRFKVEYDQPNDSYVNNTHIQFTFERYNAELAKDKI